MPRQRTNGGLVGGSTLPAVCLCVLVLAGVFAGAIHAEPRKLAHEPTPEEQLLIYELNRARSNPAGYAREQGLGEILDDAPHLPPLAINEWLTASARDHAEEMAEHDYFEHQSPITGRWPNEKARDAGYPLPADWPDERNYIESLAAGFATPAAALRALIEDAGFNPPGHRYHLLALGPDREFWRSHREVGAGYAYEAETTYGDYYVLHTAKPDSPWPFITGVIYEDRDATGRYDLHDGLDGVEVVAYGGDGIAASTVTNQAGGFSLPLLPGVYTIRVSGGDYMGVSEYDVTLGRENVHLAFLSAPSEAEFAVERDFEFQVFEPIERDETSGRRTIAAGGEENDLEQRDTQTDELTSNEQKQNSTSPASHTASRGCALGTPRNDGNATLPLTAFLALLLLGLVVRRRTG